MVKVGSLRLLGGWSFGAVVEGLLSLLKLVCFIYVKLRTRRAVFIRKMPQRISALPGTLGDANVSVSTSGVGCCMNRKDGASMLIVQ